MLKIFKTFYSFLISNYLVYLGFILLIISTNALFALDPYFYKLFVEEIPNLNYRNLLNLLLIFTAVRFFAVIMDVLTGIVGDLIVINGAKKARVTIFKKVQDLDFAFHANKSTGSLISAFKRGDGAFWSFFHDTHYKLLNVLSNFGVMIFFLKDLNSMVTISVSLSLVITAFAAKFLIQNNVTKRKEFNEDEDKISGIITDNLINFETVKLFAKEKWEENKLLKTFIPWTKKMWGYGNSFRLIDVTMGTIINLSVFSVLFFVVKDTINGKINVGDFVLITGFLTRFYPRLWEFLWGLRDLAKNYADIEKYFGLLDHEIEVKDPIGNKINLKSVKGSIQFKNVSHSYKEGTKNALKNFNLDIKSGESVAFVGRSGSGKTTITKLLMRFFDPEKGNIKIDGIDIRNLTKTNLRSFFGVVPQEPLLFNNTIAYNIGYGQEKENNLKEIKNVAKMANINEFIEKLPKKYETNVGERGIKLSGGQKQRLAIARMILSKPDIIIFDEATSSLDSESEKLIQEAFWKYAKGKTTIIIAHRLSTIQKADRIVVLDKGQIKEVGTHSDLLKNKNGIYTKLSMLQK